MSGVIEAQLQLDRGSFQLAVDLHIPAHGITAIFGPSGAGKTTLLRAIAGLERAHGHIRVNNKTWQDNATFMPPHQRRIGFVFQEPSLFEHLDVRGNLEYGQKRNGQQTDFKHIVDILSLHELLAKQPAELSGGEQKRVAIGRALLRDPDFLLLDEPLASLDLQHRQEMLPYLEKVRADADIPVLYVSHSPEEVARLADHLILMEHGKVIAAGEINTVLTRLDLPIAHGPEAAAIITAQTKSYDAAFDITTLEFAGGQLQAVGKVAAGEVRVRILARDVSLTLAHQTGTSILNILPVAVTAIDEDSPGQALARLDASGSPLLSRITRKSLSSLNIEPGTQAYAQIKAIALL